MDLTAGLKMVRDEYVMPVGSYIFVNDDNEMFACNMRPSLNEGYWSSNTHGFMTEYLGMYTGDVNWKQTLRLID